jgi:hypothetical protein
VAEGQPMLNGNFWRIADPPDCVSECRFWVRTEAKPFLIKFLEEPSSNFANHLAGRRALLV